MIIILNGSINSGKSTVAKILQEKTPHTAYVEVDELRRFIDWMDGEKAYPLSVENALLVTKNFVKKDLNVVFTYIIGEDDYKIVQEMLKDVSTNVFIFTFSSDINHTLTNRGSRELTEQELKRIQYHYDIGINNPSFGQIIDNTHQTPKETAEIILKAIF